MYAIHSSVALNTIILKIKIKDDGVGMSEEDRQNIFKPFYKTKNPLSGFRKREVVNYDLWTCAAIVN